MIHSVTIKWLHLMNPRIIFFGISTFVLSSLSLIFSSHNGYCCAIDIDEFYFRCDMHLFQKLCLSIVLQVLPLLYLSICPLIHPFVPCYFYTTSMADFEVEIAKSQIEIVFQMRSRISIRGYVRPSVGRSVGPSVGRLVGPSVTHELHFREIGQI